eukprot:1153449-Pelagomonas_calceolata.AAC.1
MEETGLCVGRQLQQCVTPGLHGGLQGACLGEVPAWRFAASSLSIIYPKHDFAILTSQRGRRGLS